MTSLCLASNPTTMEHRKGSIHSLIHPGNTTFSLQQPKVDLRSNDHPPNGRKRPKQGRSPEEAQETRTRLTVSETYLQHCLGTRIHDGVGSLFHFVHKTHCSRLFWFKIITISVTVVTELSFSCGCVWCFLLLLLFW